MGLAIVAAALVAGVALAGFVLPKHVVIGRRIIIDAPPELVFPDVGSLATWPEWTEWSPGNDPEYDPKPEGTHKLTWTKSKGGAGTQVITEADPAKGIKYKLEIDGGKFLVDGRVHFTRDGTRTAVAWIDSMDFGHSYSGRYFGAVMDSIIGPMIEKSLLTLKKRSEARAAAKGVVAHSAPPVHDAALTPPPDEPKHPVADEAKPPPEVPVEHKPTPAPVEEKPAPPPPPAVEEKPAPTPPAVEAPPPAEKPVVEAPPPPAPKAEEPPAGP